MFKPFLDHKQCKLLCQSHHSGVCAVVGNKPLTPLDNTPLDKNLQNTSGKTLSVREEDHNFYSVETYLKIEFRYTKRLFILYFKHKDLYLQLKMHHKI